MRRMADSRTARWVVGLMLCGLAGCEATTRAAKYPEGALQVRYEEATTYSTCLAASVAMAANYLLGERKYTEKSILGQMRAAGRDESRVADMKAFLEGERLYLITLSGQLNNEPPTGLGYWVKTRGYPVICVINRHPDDPAGTHAVVVIGISRKPGDPPADMVHYFDPSLPRPVSDEASAFQQLWDRGQRAMMIVVAPPEE